MTFLPSRRRRRSTTESASAVYLAFTTQPGTGGASPYTVSPVPVVAAKKSKGTTDTAKAGTVTIALVALTGSPVLSGTTTKALVSGVADFSANGLTVTGAGTWYLTATLSGLTGATSVTGTTTSGGVTTYREDLFTRTAALSGSTPTDGGSAWVTDGSTFSTDGTKLNSPDSGAAAWLESSQADCVIRCTVTADGGGGWGLTWRVVDSASRLVLRADINPGFLTPGSRATGSNTYFETQKFAYAVGDLIEIHCAGGTSSFWVNGVDTTKSIAPGLYDTATKHGVYTGAVTGTVSWDNFSVKSA